MRTPTERISIHCSPSGCFPKNLRSCSWRACVPEGCVGRPSQTCRLRGRSGRTLLDTPPAHLKPSLLLGGGLTPPAAERCCGEGGDPTPPAAEGIGPSSPGSRLFAAAALSPTSARVLAVRSRRRCSPRLRAQYTFVVSSAGVLLKTCDHVSLSCTTTLKAV